MEITVSEFLYQLGIVVVVFAVLINVFFKRLLMVLQDRESKTVLLEKDAEKRISKANELSESYRAKIDLAHRENQKVLKAKKEEILDRENTNYKEQEAVLQKETDEERQKVIASFKEKEASIMKEADALAGDLVNKIVQ